MRGNGSVFFCFFCFFCFFFSMYLLLSNDRQFEPSRRGQVFNSYDSEQ
jgi:hypothetical protein